MNRSYTLLASTEEERDLWVNAFNTILGIPVLSPGFVPLGPVTKDKLESQYSSTDRNRDNSNRAAASKTNTRPVSSAKRIDTGDIVDNLNDALKKKNQDE